LTPFVYSFLWASVQVELSYSVFKVRFCVCF
jgi:hypothetical protein